MALNDGPTSATSLLDAWDETLATWLTRASFDEAVAAVAACHGYALADVQAQLRHVVRRCRAAELRTARLTELEPSVSVADLPRSVVVLASAQVPGLVLEGIAAALALGAEAIVRPSRDEVVLPQLLAVAADVAPQLLDHVRIVGLDGGPIPWADADAAVVFGSDETVAFVRDQLERNAGPLAASRVAAYGSRQAVAIALPSAGAAPGWDRLLADDVLTFRQRGCMCPRWLYTVGDADATRRLVEQVGHELAVGRSRHVAPGVDDRAAQRRARDADVLSAIAAGLAPDSTALYAGDARITVVRTRTEHDALLHLRSLGSLRQTAVVAADDADVARLTPLLHAVGITRVCTPGQAHRPHPQWPQDGIGRLRPLVAPEQP